MPIRDENKKGSSHFNKKLNSNIANAIVLSYFGTVSEVYQILQVLSHQTRAYCVYMNELDYGMRDFLVKMPRGYEHFDSHTKTVINQLQRER